MSAPRLIAVLFADLVSSTETVASLGPEAGEAWRQRFLGVMREALAAARGREVQHTGDGIFAAFESASDAVACGVGIQQRVARASERRDAGAPAQARVGLAAGEAREDAEGVHGLVVVEAARLCSAAKPGQIFAGALVEALAAGGPQRFASIGELVLKGLPAPVAAREVIWEQRAAALPLSPRLAELAEGPFVGRAAERGRLDAALEEARRGERRLVLLAGEPGIGKTRLSAELARDAHAAGAIVLDGRCDEDPGPPFQPWMQALAHLVAHAPESELRAMLGEALAATRLVPELRRRLPDLPAPPAVDDEGERWRLFEAIDALLAGVSRGALVLVLLDDLHWADKPTLVLLRHLARSQRPAALLLLGTYRETDLARTHPLAEVLADLRRDPRVERVLLRGLDPAELGALVAARAEHEAPEGFVRRLHAETEGNPFFAEEVLRHLVDVGALRQEGGRWTADRPLAELGIPEGVREVIGRRLSRLAETTNEALRVAAVIGREFELPELEAACGIARDPLLDALDEASRARIVVEVPEAAGRFAFAHALIRQTLYEELGSARRMRLHWRVGEALERRHARDLDAHVSAIAHHLAEGVLAGDALRAADASLRAGKRAAALVAHEEARAHFERALATLDQAGCDEPERRYPAWTGIGRALLYLGEGARYRDAFLEAFRIAEGQRWTERMAQAALGATAYLVADPAQNQRMLAPVDAALAALGPEPRPERARLLSRRAFVANFANADYDRMEAGYEEAATVARLCGDPELAQENLRSGGGFLLYGSPRAHELEREAREWFEASMRTGNAFAAGVALQAYVTAAMARGDRTAVDSRVEEYRAVAERAGSRGTLTWVLTWSAGLALAEGRFGDAKRLAAESRDAAWINDLTSTLTFRCQLQAARLEQGRNAQIADLLVAFLAGAPHWLQYHRTIRASALAELGRSDEAHRELAAFDALALAQRGWSWPFTLRRLAECAALLGDEKRAAALEPLLEPYAGQLFVAYNGQVIESSADRARGQCLATLGRLDEAIACYESGLALEESFGAPALATRTRYWLACALATRGAASDAVQARTEAEAARDAAQRFGMLLLAEQAETLAARLG